MSDEDVKVEKLEEETKFESYIDMSKVSYIGPTQFIVDGVILHYTGAKVTKEGLMKEHRMYKQINLIDALYDERLISKEVYEKALIDFTTEEK